MSFIRREIYTTDKRIQTYLDKLMNDKVVEVPTKISYEISRYKTIQKIRDIDRRNPPLIISRDDKAHTSIIKIKDGFPLKIRKDGDKYYFSI